MGTRSRVALGATATAILFIAALYVDKHDVLFTNRVGGTQIATVAGGVSASARQERRTASDDADFFAGSTLPLDDGGLPVDAHEGHVLIRDDGTYLWYGTGQRRPVPASTSSSSSSTSSSSNGGSKNEWLADSIHLYTSRDLRSWRARGRVFTAAAIPPLEGGGGPPYRIERVQALYNADRRSYVLAFALSSLNYSVAVIGYASAVSPTGPFKWEGAAAPDGVPATDISIGSEGGGGGGAAYLARALPGGGGGGGGGVRNGTGISALSSDYLGTTGLCGMAPRVDTPVLFKSGDRWYLLGARRPARWKPGPLVLYAAPPGASPCSSAWTKLPCPAEGPGGAARGFDSAPAFVVPFAPGGGGGGGGGGSGRGDGAPPLLVYGGDRWNADGPGSIANASYVWLPMVARGKKADDGFVLRWYDRWRPADFMPPAAAAPPS